MLNLDEYSNDYTIKGLADVGYISDEESLFFLNLPNEKKEIVIKEIQEILLSD